MPPKSKAKPKKNLREIFSIPYHKVFKRGRSEAYNQPQDQIPPQVPLALHPTPIEPAPETDLATLKAAQKSQEIWNEAFNRIEKDEGTAEAAKAYLDILKTNLGDDTNGVTEEDVADEGSPAARQRQMFQLVEKGKAKIKESSKFANSVGSFVEYVLLAKPLGDFIIRNVPQATPAALPWASVCGALQIMCKPANANKANLEGVKYVVARMEWYCALTDILLDTGRTQSDHKFAESIASLRETIISLYQRLLIFLIQSVCSYYKNQAVVALKSIFDLNDWSESLNRIKATESTLQSDIGQYIQVHQRNTLQECSHRAQVSMGLLGDISKTLQNYVEEQRLAHRNEKDNSLLKSLCVVDPRDAMDTILRRKKEKLLADAFEWIFHDPEFQSFTGYTSHSDSPDTNAAQYTLTSESSSPSPSRLLWLKGQPGTGKTMLLVGIIRKLTSYPAAWSPSISFFFFEATDTKVNNKTAALRSLLWMLFLQQPCLLKHMRAKYDTAPSSYDDDLEFTSLSNIFKNILADKELCPAYFIIDALDECIEGLPDLITLISTSLTLTDKVKWLVSSRPNVALDINIPSNLVLELNSQNLKESVGVYIDSKLDHLATSNKFTGYTPEVIRNISLEIKSRAGDTFLWVWHIFHILFSQNENLRFLDGSHALNTVRQMPPGLSGVYGSVMDRILKGQPQDSNLCKELLRIVFLAYRPLSLEELGALASLTQAELKRILDDCSSFLSVSDQTVNLIHLSAKDYLQDNYVAKIGNNTIPQGHAEMSKRCLLVLDGLHKDQLALDGLHKNMYNISIGPYSREKPAPQPDPLAPIRYACLFWVDHLYDGTSGGSQPDESHVYSFLQKHFLHWLEGLSLLWEMTKGIMALRKLLVLFPKTETPSEIAGFVYDALRLTLFFRSCIEDAPLQTYASALLFSPTNNKVRRCFAEKELDWIVTKPIVPSEWDACLQTIVHGSQITSLDFSPDGTLLAASSYDKSIKIWDVLSGECKQTIEIHEGFVISIAFSPDGKKIASASTDRTIKFSDVLSGECEQTLEGARSWGTPIVFSPDGKRLAFCSVDNTIKICKVSSGQHEQILNGHQGSVLSIAFSLDGKTLVSFSNDEGIKFWNVLSGECERTLDSSSKTVASVSFSPCRRQIATASYHGVVRIQNVSSGKYEQTLQSDPNPSHIVFSPDGRHIASSSRSGDVVVWDVLSGECKGRFKAYQYDSLIAFSPDSKQLAFTSFASTAKIWDFSSEEAVRALESHDSWVKHVQFSQDGERLVSGSGDGAVCFWDAMSGKCTRKFQDGLEGTEFIPLSDGCLLAYNTPDYSIKILNLVSGKCLATLRGHTDIMRYAVISSDGTQLAAWSLDTNIKIWSLASGECLKTIEMPLEVSVQVFFSPDGRLLALIKIYGHKGDHLEILDWSSEEHLQTLECSLSHINCIAFSPDGRQIAAHNADRLHLWYLASGKYLLDAQGSTENAGYPQSEGRDSPAYTVASTQSWPTEKHRPREIIFSPDGRQLATRVEYEYVAKVWDVGSGQCTRTLENFSKLNTSIFTPEEPLQELYELNMSRSWITNRGKEILWLPDEYRTWYFAESGNIIALGLHSGRVVTIGFKL